MQNVKKFNTKTERSDGGKNKYILLNNNVLETHFCEY